MLVVGLLFVYCMGSRSQKKERKKEYETTKAKKDSFSLKKNQLIE